MFFIHTLHLGQKGKVNITPTSNHPLTIKNLFSMELYKQELLISKRKKCLGCTYS